MKKSAQVVIQHTDQHDADLHKGLASNVGQITGEPISPESLNPEDQSHFQKISEGLNEGIKDAGEFARTTGEEIGGGATYIRGTGSETVSAIAQERKGNIAQLWK